LGKNHNDKEDNKKHPFNNDIQTCCACGDCCLIHQQFTLEERFNFNQETTVTIYEANAFVPACTPGQPSGDAGITQQEPVFTFPFGTVIAFNNGITAFDFKVVGENGEEDAITKTVFPGARVAISGLIQRVDAIYPPSPCRTLFDFDIFLAPPDPITPPAPV